MPFGHRVGGWVSHFPVVVCTNSPSTPESLRPRADYVVRPRHTEVKSSGAEDNTSPPDIFVGAGCRNVNVAQQSQPP